MAGHPPSDTLRDLIAAFNAGEVKGALALYDQATFVAAPGKVANGLAGIRAELEDFLATQPRLEVAIRQTIETEDLALICTSWSLTNTGSNGMPMKRTGQGAVVLRRQIEGTWVIAIENPWADLE